MKHIATIILLLATQFAFAKGTVEDFTTAGPIVGSGSFPHFTPGGSGDAINNKVSLRLIAKTYLTHNGVKFIPHDSITYKYYNDRGGLPNVDDLSKDDNILFSESYSYNFDSKFGNYSPTLHRVQNFGQDKNVVSLVYSNWRISNNVWKDSIRYLYSYSNGKMISSAFERWLGNIWSNGIVSSIQYTGDVVSKMNSDLYEVYFTYDANNNLTSVSDKELTPGGWQNKYRHTYEYSNKDIIKYTLEIWDASASSWTYSKMWEYSYVGPDVETETEHYHTGSFWAVTGRHLYTYDGSHNKLLDIWQVWNTGYQNDTRTEWVYNSQNLPEIVTTQTWDGSIWKSTSKDQEYHYYYETYFPESVNKYNLSTAELNTYPIPTNTNLNINMHLNEAQPLQFGIYNTQGIQVAQWNEPATKQYSNSISVANLPSGQYFLKVIGKNDAISRSFIVAR
jgi:hypothetical protein